MTSSLTRPISISAKKIAAIRLGQTGVNMCASMSVIYVSCHISLFGVLLRSTLPY